MATEYDLETIPYTSWGKWLLASLALMVGGVFAMQMDLEFGADSFVIMKSFDSLGGVKNFALVVVLSSVFMVVSTTATSVYLSMMRSYLDDLEPLFCDAEEGSHNADHAYVHWRNHFVLDLRRKLPVGLLFLLFSAIAQPIHYFLWSYQVYDRLGWQRGLTGSLALAAILLVGSFVVWLLLAQFFHLYRFTRVDKKANVMLLGATVGLDRPTSPTSSRTAGNGLITALARWLAAKHLIPAATASHCCEAPNADCTSSPGGARPRPRIKIDIFNADNLAGLSPLANMSTLGTVLLGIVFALSVPIVMLGLDSQARIWQIVILGVFFVVIVGSYLLGVTSLRDAIRLEKRRQLGFVNTELSVYAKKIIGSDKAKEDDTPSTELPLEDLMVKFRVFEEIGEKIQRLPESPRSLGAIFKVVTSGSLPLLSVGTLNQIDLLSLF